MSDEAAATFPMTLAGREIVFRRAGIGQVIMLQRRAVKKIKAAEDVTDDARRVDLSTTALVEVFDFIEHLIVSDDDRQFVEDKMLTGEIVWEDLVHALGGGDIQKQMPDDQAPAPRKSTAKKTPKAAPVKASAAKTVASRGRTKR